MINVKLVVLLLLLACICASFTENCEICPNHTLCKYQAGPSRQCVGYDVSALLTRAEEVAVLARINEHRDHVARGLSSRLPPAANMRKISWSAELARAAQRWADQCDAATRPDTHDQCRNLANTAVGQNIATIFGPAPGLNVKSFVDIWYMQILDFTGSVTLYNQSLDQRTSYFTQLVWAETDTVGCGKAKFYIESANTVIERLVCNFAPRGNILGRPVYTVGFAGTQCPGHTAPDPDYPGLCTRNARPAHPTRDNEREIGIESTPATSLLRILNLSNDSIKHGIDPKDKQTNLNEINSYPRNQKIRHIFNNSFAADMSSFLPRPPWNIFNDSKRFTPRSHQHERGHSRVYHGHDHILSEPTTMLNFRRYDYTTAPLNLYTDNMVQFNQNHPCTRGGAVNIGMDCTTPHDGYKCTRGRQSSCLTPLCDVATPHDSCGCSTQAPCMHSTSCNLCCTTCPTTYNMCPHFTANHCCQNKCQGNQPSSCCPNIGRRAVELPKHGNKFPDLPYYDLWPNLAVKSGDSLSQDAKVFHKKLPLVSIAPLSDQELSPTVLYNRKQYDISNGQLKSDHKLPKYSEEQDYSYGSFDSSDRFRRESDDNSYKELWNLKEHNPVNPLQLKALRYTTLTRTKSTQRTSSNAVTEPITFNLRSLGRHEDNDHITEKFVLSFDDLMRLRKSNTGKFNARRQEARGTTERDAIKKHVDTHESKTTEKEAKKHFSEPNIDKVDAELSTSTVMSTKQKHFGKYYTSNKAGVRRADAKNATVYTVNSPFKPVSRCTRKITCTWTQFTMTATASDGSIIIIDSGDKGDRTPPGYVEGCTRTSTCTRHFLDRNKISTIPTTVLTEETLEDEDYCEKRALNVKRRNSNNEDEPTRIKRSTKDIFEHKNLEVNNKSSDGDNVLGIRLKRANRHQTEEGNQLCDHKRVNDNKNPLMSYGELYYLVLRSLLESGQVNKTSHKSKNCFCNGNVRQQNRTMMNNTILLMLVINIIYVASLNFILN